MNIRFLRSKDKKKLINKLESQFGIGNLPHILIETGNEKIRGFSGTMNKDEISELSEIANIEIIGFYLIKKEKIGLRISFDAAHVLKSQIKKNVLNVDKEQMEIWMKGNNLNIQKERGIYAVKFEEDFLGCGISDEKKIINFVPKERRIRN